MSIVSIVFKSPKKITTSITPELTNASPLWYNVFMRRLAVCPKCEKFLEVDPDCGPVVYCEHFLGSTDVFSLNSNIPSEIVHIEKVTCKVITLGDENL